MPGGIPVTSYSDFVKDTGPFIYSSPTEMINDAMRQKTMFKWLMKGRKASDVVQGGQYIQDVLLLRDKATAENYNPGDSGTPTQPQVQTVQTEYWRWSRDHMAWQDEVVELNAAQLSAKARFQKYKDFKRVLNQSFWTSYLNFLDSKFWQTSQGSTQYAAMEGAAGTEQKSILSFISENNTTYAPIGWTNIHGVPAATTNYTNQIRRYDYADLRDANKRNNGLLDAFQRMYNDLQWDSPGIKDEFFTESDPRRNVIICSKFGHALACKVMREENQLLRKSPSDNDAGIDGPVFLGIPIEFHQDLDTVLHYPKNGTYYSEMDSTLGTSWSYTNSSTHDYARGPRFYWLDWNYLRGWFNDTFHFKMDGPMSHMNTPGTYVSWVRTGWNLFCRSRKRLGVVSPGASSSVTL